MTSAVHRVVAGHPDTRSHGGNALLAYRLAHHARSLGLRVTALIVSRLSCSRYLQFEDRDGRPWSMRISDHFKPRLSGPAFVQLEVISRDGASGYDEAAALITAALLGDIAWFDPEVRERRPRSRRRRRVWRSQPPL